ncbi:MAG TPA: GAF domain-containing protein [Gaiellaceae bacterium]|nr:GAF domain-containing protein [Gaiellaceae bacterium]
MNPLQALFGRRARAAPTVRADESPAAQDARRGRDLKAISSLSEALGRAADARAVARTLLDEVRALVGADFCAVAVINDEARTAEGLVAVDGDEEVDWWEAVRIDFDTEPSAIVSAALEAEPIAIYDVGRSPQVSRRLAERVGAKSAAFVPLVADEQVRAVLVVATTEKPRVFEADELSLLQTLAAEAALALERTRSASELAEALERERIVSSIGRKVRSELDVEAVLRVAVEETGRAAGASRCFIRLGEPGEPMPIRAEWDDEGFVPIGSASEVLPVSNLAARERRTVACEDVRTDPAFDDPTLGRRQALLDLGTIASLATPILVFGRMIGVFTFHCPEAKAWSSAEISLAEAVAREVGLAIHAASLLELNERRLEQQEALLKAAQAVASELRLETVLQRLVVEVTNLLDADAADCYLLDEDSSVLRCAAVNGLDPTLVEFEFPADRGLAGEALRTGRSAMSNEYAQRDEPFPHAAYSGFTAAVAAPMTWAGEARGVLGVGSRDPERSFGPDDAELLEAFAGLAGLAVRNAASFEQSVRQARIERGFFGIASALAEPLSQTATLDAVANAASVAIGASCAAVLMPEGRELTLAASYQLPAVLEESLQAGIPDSASVLATCAEERRVLAAPAVAEDDRFDEDWRGLVSTAGLGALLAIPVDPPRRDAGGLAVVFFAEPRSFSDDDLELAQKLAGAARGALERSELFESERTSRALSQQLARMGSLLAAELDPAAVLDEVVQQAPTLLAADASCIRVVEDDELIVTAVHGPGLEGTLGSRAPTTAWLAGDVVQLRTHVVLADAGSDSRLLADDPALAAGYRGYLGVPLVGAEGGTQGVLAVYSRRPRAWRDEEVEALSALAGNASAVLTNAELYQSVALERERSFAILANIADGIVAVDRDEHVVLWNTAAEQITGVPAAAALGKTPYEVIHRELASEGGSRSGERLVPIQRGADEVWLSLTEAVMRDPTGGVAGRIFAFRDVSAERLVEQMKSDFVSTVSHELRAPLTSIYGFAETLLRRDVLFGEEERQTFLGYVASEAQRLTGIVDALLSVARLDAGDLQVEVGAIDVRSVVSEVVGAAESSPAGNAHRFVVSLPDEPLAAAADQEKLRQILANLVDNAVRFSPPGGNVTVEARRSGGAVEVRVVDEGIGIPAGERERIFRKFHRLEGGGRERGGTGLGLFIARGLVSAMGGRIWVDSDEGRGSIFAFELPLAADPVLERE